MYHSHNGQNQGVGNKDDSASNRGTDETWVESHARCWKAARKIWIQMGLPFLYHLIAESIWRAMGWVCDQRPNALVASLKQVFRWRSSQWWHTTHTEGMRDDPVNHTRWKQKWKWHNRGNVCDKLALDWAGKKKIGSAKERTKLHQLTRQNW